MKWPRLIAAMLALVALGSCSRVFLVKAAFLDGALIFKSGDNDRTFYPWCWHSFAIADAEGRPVWEFEVPYGAFQGDDKCGPNFPIRYGQPPDRAETMVAAERLEVGRLYVITGDSAGLLEGAFKIERVNGGLKVRNLDPGSSEAVAARDLFSSWQRDRDPPRISQTPTTNAAFEVQAPPQTIPKSSRAGPSGTDELTWVLHADEWWNLPSLSYRSLTGGRTQFNLWCRYTAGPIYARVPPPADKGARISLRSGQIQTATYLVGAGNPNRRDRINALLDDELPVLKRFEQTGELALEGVQGSAEMNAVNDEERAVIRRFFRLCREPHRVAAPVEASAT